MNVVHRQRYFQSVLTFSAHCLKNVLMIAVVLTTGGVGLSRTAYALNQQQAQVYNMLGTALFTTLSAALQGNIHEPRDILKTAGWGALGGYGFFHSRKLIAQGDVHAGITLSFLSSSVVENVSLGEHPLAYGRYGLGPLEIRIATPLAAHPRAWISFETDIAEIPLFLYVLSKADEVRLRDGLVYGVVDAKTFNVFRTEARGVAPGRSILVARPDAGNHTLWRHESLHVSQNIQWETWLARPQTWKRSSEVGPGEPTQLFGVNFRFGGLVLGRIFLEEMQKYDSRWIEREVSVMLGE